MPNSLASHLSPIDLGIVAFYLIAITLFGLRFAKKGKQAKSKSSSLKSYFLADNAIPWWAIALSIVSAETSTLTIVSIPGVAFAGNLGFLQIVLGYMLGRIVVAMLFLPKYFRGEMLTAYQLIDRRFGHALHKITAGLFLLTRAAAEGVRVFAISIVVSLAIGTGDTLSIAIISALTLLYTFEGGMAAVIWTDVVQMALYLAGTVVALITLGHNTPGGWPHIAAVAAPLGKFHWLDFTLNLTTTYTFWAGILGGTFLTMASHGTDQLMVQRLLAARNLRESRLALLSSGAVIFLQFTLFLLIGVGLFVFYGSHPQAFKTNDYIFPTYIVQQMPHGIAGLLIAAILAAAMSNLSAALNSLASTTVIDFYVPFRTRTKGVPQVMPLRPGSGPAQPLGAPFISQPHREMSGATNPSPGNVNTTLISRAATIFWAIILFLIALYSIKHGGKGHVVETGLSIASVAYGSLLGVFLLGTLTKYATQTGAIIGMICGFALNLTLWQASLAGPFFPIPGLPHVAFTWYVLIGAIATFAIGTLFSVILPRKRTTILTAAALLLLLSFPKGICFSPAHAQQPPTKNQEPKTNSQPYDFTPVSALINDAIAAKKLPGAVLLIGHNGQVVFHQAYGVRKLAGEPGLDGKPSAAEPMTEDTIFDMASLTKVIVTTTAILQLYEQGKLDLDAPVAKYLPEFASTTGNTFPATNKNLSSFAEGGGPASRPSPASAQTLAWKSQITIRQLLTHYSGLPEDVSLKDDWGLKSPDKAEGIRRAMASIPYGPPGQTFKYSDINFITLGYLVENVSGQDLDVYARDQIFQPLGITTTRYLPYAKACGAYEVQRFGAATEYGPPPKAKVTPNSNGGSNVAFPGLPRHCDPVKTWSDDLIFSTAPTAHDDESKANPTLNPDFDHLLRGTVHDPTTRRMGGVAGHAGLFSTAADMSLFCQALLDKLTKNTGPFPLKQSTLQLATSPQAPATAHADATIFTQDQQPTKGVAQRGLGWDLNSAFSRPRGEIFPITTKGHPGSFGHTGFTGTSLWLDPTSNTYVILLANAIHPHGNPPISPLRGAVATAAAKALGLAEIAYQPKDCDGKPDGPPVTVEQVAATELYCRTSGATDCPGVLVCASALKLPGAPGLASETWASSEARQSSSTQSQDPALQSSIPSPQLDRQYTPTKDNPNFIPQPRTAATHKIYYAMPPSAARLPNHEPPTQTGIDVLEQTQFTPLKPFHNIAVLTNQSGLDAHGNRTIDLLAKQTHLTKIFTPEHGLSAKQDTESLKTETDPTTNLSVISLYGAKPADRHPTHDQLKDLDAVVIDLQDAGVHFWTYEAAAGYFLEAASAEQTDYHHDLQIILLDRPNLVGGVATQGPVSDPGSESYVNYMPLPVRHGLTFGELAKYIVVAKHLQTHLTVIPMQNWTRTEYFAETGLPWTNPSPNLRSPEEAILYPAIGLIDCTNISVGRGSPHPFSFFGAAWLKAADVAAALTARHIPGATFTAVTEPIAEDANHYPFHGQTIEAIRVTVTDREALDTPELGVEILSVLHRLYPTQFKLPSAKTNLCSAATLAALEAGADPREIAATWAPALQKFRTDTAPYLLYK